MYMIKFYDTCALLNSSSNIFEDDIYISSITLTELEDIKTNRNKTEEIKAKARDITRNIDKNSDKVHLIIVTEDIYKIVSDFRLPITNDNLIIASAYFCKQYVDEDIIFITSDLCCKNIAKSIFKLSAENPINENDFQYKGFKVIALSDDEVALYYTTQSGCDSYILNKVNDCLINEYFLLQDSNGVIFDAKKYTSDGFISIKNNSKSIKTILFGDKIKPKDVYQELVVDSIMSNTITAISGKAGSGKSFLSLVTAFKLIESGKYNKLVVLFNPTKTKGSEDMGYYGGSFLEKAKANSIGNILSTKLGGEAGIDMLIKQDKLKLISMADARGMEIKDDEILYITECQNTSIPLLKLCLQRCSEKSKVIIEGDFTSQVDSYNYEGSNNGLKKVIETLKDTDIFGYVELQNIHRSRLAELIDKM